MPRPFLPTSFPIPRSLADCVMNPLLPCLAGCPRDTPCRCPEDLSFCSCVIISLHCVICVSCSNAETVQRHEIRFRTWFRSCSFPGHCHQSFQQLYVSFSGILGDLGNFQSIWEIKEFRESRGNSEEFSWALCLLTVI